MTCLRMWRWALLELVRRRCIKRRRAIAIRWLLLISVERWLWTTTPVPRGLLELCRRLLRELCRGLLWELVRRRLLIRRLRVLRGRRISTWGLLLLWRLCKRGLGIRIRRLLEAIRLRHAVLTLLERWRAGRLWLFIKSASI